MLWYVVCFLRLGVWVVVIFVLSVMRVVGGVPLWVEWVSSCRCCVFVSVVHPVAILSAVFCVIGSLLMFVSGACGVGVSDVYMLKSVGDSTPPCGTPFLNWRCVDVLCLNVVYALRPLM